MKIQITTPARLHFGLIDLNGELGRINGGFGVAIENPCWKISLVNSRNHSTNQSKFEEKIIEILEKLDKIYNKDILYSSNFNILSKIPAHVGLGSGTQFALAIARLYMEFHKIEKNAYELAKIVKRGGTSGIGVAAFEKGGFILDGGHSFGPGKQTNSFLPSSKSLAPPPPILFRFFPPENWRFVIIIPTNLSGLSGNEELEIFQKKCPVPAKDAEKLSRLILMKILPALVEKNIKVFGEGITEMQTKFDRFGLEKYNNSIVNDVLNLLRDQKEIFGSGISSFGPTVFALVENQTDANLIIKKISENFMKNEFSILDSTKINITGAVISIKNE